MREAERGEKRKRRTIVQSISSASNASAESGSSSDCEVEKVVVKKKSAIFLGKKEVNSASIKGCNCPDIRAFGENCPDFCDFALIFMI